MNINKGGADMTKAELKKAVETALETLDLKDEIIFSVGDLDKISALSGVPFNMVMYYLRFLRG